MDRDNRFGRFVPPTDTEIALRAEQEARGELPHPRSTAEEKAARNFRPRTLVFGNHLTTQPTEVYPDQAEARDIFSAMVSELSSTESSTSPEEVNPTTGG